MWWAEMGAKVARDGAWCLHQVYPCFTYGADQVAIYIGFTCICAGAQVERKSTEMLTVAMKCSAGKEQVSKGMKGEKAGGIYFPITAVQVDLQPLLFSR